MMDFPLKTKPSPAAERGLALSLIGGGQTLGPEEGPQGNNEMRTPYMPHSAVSQIVPK
jgi:hypothetical protein